MTGLCFRERDQRDETACLARVVVRDRRLQVLSHRGRLPELAVEPAEQAHRGLVGHAPTLPCRAPSVVYAPCVAFGTVDDVEAALRASDYLPDRGLATALFLATALGKPVLLEGEAGVGKTEAAKALARAQGARLIRLQCYEGLDVAHAVYEWNYTRQLLHIRAAQEGGVSEEELFGPAFLIRRPLLEAVEADEPVVLLVDEIDRADEEFEAFLLEILSDFQITIPELGTIARSAAPGRGPHVEPDPRAARRAQAPLPLPLDRPSVSGARGRDRRAAVPGVAREARARGRGVRAAACAGSTSRSRRVSRRRSTGRRR